MSILPSTNYHLRPARGWLNDPNGMVRHEGRWHVFFQHNPESPQHHRIAWGHVSSTDLLSWREHPVAFGPTPDGPDQHGCWSGVLVVEEEGPVAVYSGIASDDGRSTVCLRRGTEDLLRWGPPEVVARTPEVDGVAVMRDPFVFRHEGRRFAVLGAGLDDGSPAILLFSCDDLTQWDYLGLWLTAKDPVASAALPADVWECPQLAVQDGRAVLVLSLHDDGVLGSVVACTGQLVDDGGLPRLVPEQVRSLDTGGDFYAPQLADDGGQGWWLMGWVRDETPDLEVSDHAGCMTLPRRLVLDGTGAQLILDPAAQDGLVVGERRVASGPLVGHLQVEVGEGGARLLHDELGERSLAAGTLVFVDGPVLEAYPPDAVPATFRHREPWSVSGDAEVGEVLTSAWVNPLPPTGRATC